MRILLTDIGLAGAAILAMFSYAEKQQEASLDTLSSYKLQLQPQPDDPDLKLVTARSPYMRNER